MKKSTIVIIICVIIALAGLYWFMRGSSTTYTPPTTDQSATQTGDDTDTIPSPINVLALGVSNTLGNYLVSASTTMTLYTYKNDSVGTTTCSDACATNWPPYTVSSPDNLTVSAGVSGAVGTIVRPDGTYQVTYNGMPLYFYNKDMAVGDVNGNGVGGLWSIALP